MPNVTIEEAQARLPDLIQQLQPGDVVVITQDNRPVAKLVGDSNKSSFGLRLPPGLGKGCISIVSDDDSHLQDFAEYMP